jgi:NAD(P)-dependent dehydrogenase (short-subunit alcohol dehydrogenase family)
VRFEEKTVVVIGGGRGLGRAFATALAGEGACIALVDVDAEAVLDTASELAERGFETIGVPCDVREEHDVERAMHQVDEQFGRIDILVNSAALHGRRYNQPFASLERDDVRAMFDVNVMGILNCSLACRPMLAATGNGVVINLASTAANIATTPYGVSKLAARGLTVALASEFAADNIRVNAISPGFVGSAGTLAECTHERLIALLASQGVNLPPQVLAKCSREDLASIFLSQQLLARGGTMDAVVKALLYLCSDDAGLRPRSGVTAD